MLGLVKDQLFCQFFFFFKSTIYYTEYDGSPRLQKELYMEYQYPNLFLYSYPTQKTTKELNL